MELKEIVREALEIQVLESDAGGAARLLEQAARDYGNPDLAGILLDTAAVLLRRMVTETDEAYDAADLLSRLALDGAVPEGELELLMRTLQFAAASAGGVRPPIDALAAEIGADALVFGAWLTVLTVLRVVSITVTTTEAELVDDLQSVLDVF